MQVSNLRPSRY